MIVLIFVLFILLGLSDFPKLVHEKKWYDVSVLSCYYVFIFTLAALQSFGVILPSPIKGIQKFIIDILHLGYPESV